MTLGLDGRDRSALVARRGALCTLLISVLVAVTAACSGGDAAPVPTTTTTLAPSPTTTLCVTQAPLTYASVAGIDPYAAIGARQRTGPVMIESPLPDQPVSIDVQRPPDPDQLAAARQPDGVSATLASTITPSPTAPPLTLPADECWQSTDGSDGP